MLRLTSLAPLLGLMAGCAIDHPANSAGLRPIQLELTVLPDEKVEAAYRFAEPIQALHFPHDLGKYREQAWQIFSDHYRWVQEDRGVRVERTDGRRFDRIAFDIAIDYRALPKSYAPFSPFSEGSFLIYSGHFQACVSSPCENTDDLPVTVTAFGKTIGVDGQQSSDQTRFISEGDGTNIFVGTLEPVAADGFIAIIDPGLPGSLRDRLDRSLQQSMREYAEIYGPLSFRPELYVSIDARPEAGGGESSQGGTLPNQIFMHFDGAHARERLAEDKPYWLDWFFAHEAAHLFQQDKVGRLAGDDGAAWIHEGGADAMAALALAGRGTAENTYVRERVSAAEGACAQGLGRTPLDQAGSNGNFDLHYQCGLIFWLALDADLRAAGRKGLNDVNRAFFARVLAGKPWNERVLLESATELGVSARMLQLIRSAGDGDSDTRVKIAQELARLARQSPAIWQAV